MKRGWIRSAVLLGIAGLAAAPALAQMPEMGAPEQMKAMAGMVGKYDVKFEYRMAPDQDFTPVDAQAAITTTLDGACQRMEFSTTMMGMPFQGVGWTSYSRGLGKYQATWVDNMNAAISYYEGSMTGGKLVFTGEEVGPDGTKMLGRHTYYDMTDSGHKWTMEASADGGKTWTVWAKADYVKQGGMQHEAMKDGSSKTESGGW